MKWFACVSSLISLLILVASGCGRQGRGMPPDGDSTAIVQRLYDTAMQLREEQNEDSTLAVMLIDADYAPGCKDRESCYKLYHALAQVYEKKNLFDLQEKSLLRKLDAAQAMGDAGKTATTLFELGVSRYSQNDDEQALKYLEQACQKSPTDSASLRAKCQLMRCQVFLQTEETDSVEAALQQAREDFPPIAKEEAYHLSEVYMLNNTGREREAEEKARRYMETDSIHAQIELLRVLLEIHKENGKSIEALEDARLLMELSDSVVQMEASASMANIHRLQHEEQMKLAAANEQMLMEKSRARIWSLLALLTLVASVSAIAVVMFRRKAVAAAVTAMVIPPGGEEEFPDVSDFVIDRPFYFTIQHRPTNTILFVGRMMEIGKPTLSPDSINPPESSVESSNQGVRNLYGIKVADNATNMSTLPPGIYITNGKKIVIK